MEPGPPAGVTDMPADCPPDAALHAFATLEDGASADDTLLNHLLACPACQSRLDALAENLPTPAPAPTPTPADTVTGPAEEEAFSSLATRIVRGLRGGLANGQGLGDGRYQIVRSLGSGGMGEVFEATDTRLKRAVAIKTLRPGAFQPETLGRLRAEAAALANLHHPGIVQVFEWSETGGLPWLAMEYIPGVTLSNLLRQGSMAPRDAATLVARVARAMEHAHSQGILHRDLKPSNILLVRPGTPSPEGPTTWQPKVIDFGLSKWTDGPSAITYSGTLIGTPAYMAPELAAESPGHVTPRADLYSLGAVLYQCLTGQPPFPSESVANTLQLIRNTEPLRPRFFDRRIPRDLETICLKCLGKDPATRYASAKDLADDLDRFLQGRPIVARPVGKLERAWRWVTRNRRLTTALVLLASMVALYAWRESRLRRQANALAQQAEAETTRAALEAVRADAMLEGTLQGYQRAAKTIMETAFLTRRQGNAAEDARLKLLRANLLDYSKTLTADFLSHPEIAQRHPDWLGELLWVQLILAKDAGDTALWQQTSDQLLELLAKLDNPPRDLLNMELAETTRQGTELTAKNQPDRALQLFKPVWQRRLKTPVETFVSNRLLMPYLEKLKNEMLSAMEAAHSPPAELDSVRRQWADLQTRVQQAAKN